MQDYLVCECTPVTDTLVVCAPVLLSHGQLEAVYLGPSGAFSIAGDDLQATSTSAVELLRDLCCSSRVCLYHRGTGQLVTPDGTTDGTLSEPDLLAAIYNHTLHGPTIWDRDRINRLQEQLRIEDAKHRGIYRNDSGSLFVARGGRFFPMSEYDPDKILSLTLFGGILGLHRFRTGKWFSGIVYLLTGGLMGLGWLMDLMQLMMGSMMDKQKRLIPKPKAVGPMWCLFGIVSGFAIFCLYAIAAGALTATLSQVVQQSLQQTTPENASRILSLLQLFSVE